MIDKGDFLVFAALSEAVGLSEELEGYMWQECEYQPGQWERHPTVTPADSRSRISRDGILGMLVHDSFLGFPARARRILQHGWKRGFLMRGWGALDYRWMLPIVPFIALTAASSRWKRFIPTPNPAWLGRLSSKQYQGFRGHLMALLILIERLNGRKRRSHLKTAELLWAHNPTIFFVGLVASMDKEKAARLRLQTPTTSNTWGGCSDNLYAHLARWITKEPKLRKS